MLGSPKTYKLALIDPRPHASKFAADDPTCPADTRKGVTADAEHPLPAGQAIGLLRSALARGFLQIGGTALGGLALNQILEMEARAGVGSNHRAIINIYLPGGPPHLDMWDLKPEAPLEIRGQYKPIKTNVPGIEICELFPKIAAMMDKFIVVRSLCDSDGGTRPISA